MKLYTVGQRVNTEHGEGVIIGFETFGEDGWATDHAQVDNGVSRIVVKLDVPNMFYGGKLGNPFFYRSDKLDII